MEFVDPIYDKNDIQRMRKAIKRQVNGDRNLLLFELGLATAMRPSDLLALTAGDVRNGIVRLRTSKRNKSLDIRLNDRVHTLVKAYTEFMDDEERLFPIHRSTAWRFLKKAAEECCLEENIGAHSMRKTKAYHLYTSGETKHDIAIVMELLQHDDAGDTLRYIGYKKDELNKALVSQDL